MEVATPAVMAKKLWQVIRVAYFMLRKGISKRKATVGIHLLLKRGKLAGKKAIGNLIYHHNHSNVRDHSHVDPTMSCYVPSELEDSCSSTPSHPSFGIMKPKNRAKCDAEAIKKAFEILNFEMLEEFCYEDDEYKVANPLWRFGRTPAPVRQLRITDSPYPIKEEEGEEEGGGVDEDAEEFIRKFYEQLRRQHAWDG